MASLNDIRGLLDRLQEDLYDHESFEVLLDWAEEQGFKELVTVFRDESDDLIPGLYRQRVLQAFLTLFGRKEHGIVPGHSQYTALCGIQRGFIPVFSTAVFTCQTQMEMVVQRLFIPDSIGDRVEVHSFRIGHYEQLAFATSVPGSAFGSQMPDCVEQLMRVSEWARVSVENFTDEEVTFSACLFGVQAEGQTGQHRLARQLSETSNRLIAMENENREMKERINVLEKALLRTASFQANSHTDNF